MSNTTKVNTPPVPSRSKESTASALTTNFILRLLALAYDIKHVHIQHRRDTVLKLVPAFDETRNVGLVDIHGNKLFVNQKQFRGKGGRTIASVTLANGLRIEAVAITNNQSKFVKSVGYNQALLNLWHAIEATALLQPQFNAAPDPEAAPAPTPTEGPAATQPTVDAHFTFTPNTATPAPAAQ
jgi:hypothetical protein